MIHNNKNLTDVSLRQSKTINSAALAISAEAALDQSIFSWDKNMSHQMGKEFGRTGVLIVD